MRGSAAGRRVPGPHLIGLLAAIATLVVPTAAGATPPGQNGRIYYQGPEAGTSGPADIFGINPDGSGGLDLTPNKNVHDERPSVSPDGQRIAFQTFRDGGWNIFTIGTDGSNPTNVTKTKDPVIGFEPTWSPDGAKIVYMRQNPGQDLWQISPNGANATNLTDSPETEYEAQPEYSPDGSKIAFVSAGASGSNNDIWVMDANGGNLKQLTFTETPTQNLSPTWSPDGMKIAFATLSSTSDDGIHVMDAGGGNQHRILNNGSPILGDHMSWSPDGTRIAYVQNGILTVAAAGGAPVPLVKNSGADYPSWAPIAAAPPPAAGAPVVQTAAPGATPAAKKRAKKCRKGFRKKRVKGKTRCVRRKPHKKPKNRPGRR
jgi:Tol biopolymer transport system component